MFPIHLKSRGASVPDAPVAYELASNGLFEVRSTPFYRSITRFYGDVPGLEPEHQAVELLGPELPATLMEDVVAFFGEVYRLCDGEGVVVLFFDAERQAYRFEVPVQTVEVVRREQGKWSTLLGVKYERVARPEGWLRCGTIHSHADQAAHASHTDCTDEKHEDGLHVVVGHLHRERLSLSAAVVAAGVRFPVDPDEVLEPFDMSSAGKECPQALLERVYLELRANGRRARVRLTATRHMRIGAKSRRSRA